MQVTFPHMGKQKIKLAEKVHLSTKILGCYEYMKGRKEQRKGEKGKGEMGGNM